MIDTIEKQKKAEEILKKEGKYLQYLKWKKRGAMGKVHKMLEDVLDKYGQNLDGDMDFKHKTDEKVKL